MNTFEFDIILKGSDSTSSFDIFLMDNDQTMYVIWNSEDVPQGE
jgi:hypothetical protein